jgi:quercetin dioxygenase-like cupin family protein
MRRWRLTGVGGLALCVGMLGGNAVAIAQDQNPPAITEAVPGLKRAVLQKFDVPGTNYELVLLRVEFPAGFEVSRHSHPGPEASYVLEGEITYLLDGEPPAKRVAGESIELPMDAVHGAKIGPSRVVLLNSYVLVKGRPLVEPAKGPPPLSP